MYAIISGTAEVTQGGTVVRTLGPGDIFGEIAVMASGRRTATVSATTNMELTAVLNRDLWRVERRSPEIGQSLRRTIAECLEAGTH
jgi:CRP-like cAMP-binding protein